MITSRSDNERIELPAATSCRLNATIRTREQVDHVAVIRNLSPEGVGILTVCSLAVGDRISLCLTCDEGTFAFEAFVRWVSTDGARTWSAGCKFDAPLERTCIDQVCTGQLPTQIPERAMISLDVTARRNRGAKVQHDVTIVNCSAGGVCVRSRERFEPGESLILEFANRTAGPDRLAAVVQWSQAALEEQIIGCSFVTPQAFATVRDAAKRSSRPLVSSDTHRATWSGFILAVLCCLLLIAGCWPHG